VEVSCECGNELSGSVNCWELFRVGTTGGFTCSAQLVIMYLWEPGQ
jgi:hypothetical protein